MPSARLLTWVALTCWAFVATVVVDEAAAAYHAVPHWTNPDTVDEDRRRHEEAIAKRRQELFDTLGYDWPQGDLPKAITDLKDLPRFHGEL
ncbi:hypothetical protein H4R34_005318 [Dimargaris verticillata]|uniref:Uncharacterized protein n=1 Tax=Dimargaris verticillata TaxID=2761393 RepID=A0A9W8B3U1_9FUNG|nr:hypothetical protein H4R34_005318 [Dimargaris verticillata]